MENVVLSQRYELLQQIGRGGMGVVWRAHDKRLLRDVALKLLHAWVAEDDEDRSRFDREAQVLAQLTHPHIVRLYDYQESDSTSFLVMELIEGRNLGEETFERLPLGWEEARHYMLPVCDALAYAHAKGVVHRDLSPANILVESGSGRVVVSDFGLARLARLGRSLTSTGVLVGKPEYWAPEQAMGAPTSAATDLYALGCVLFQLLSGRLPFEGEDRLALGMQRIHDDAPALESVAGELPEAAVALVSRLLQRDPSSRPQAAEAGALLAAEGAAMPGTAATVVGKRGDRSTAVTTQALPKVAPEPPPPTVPLRRRRRRWLIALVLAGLVAAVLAAGAVFVLRDQPSTGGTLPRLIGLSPETARRRLTLAGGGAKARAPRLLVVGRSYSERYPAGRIIGQRPAAGKELKRDVPVRVRLSRGSAWAQVPPILSGNSYERMASQLAAAGFKARRRFTPSETMTRGRILGTRPAAGTRLHRPATVVVVLSSGPPQALVPVLRGQALEQAQALLAERRFRYRLSYKASSKVAPGQVLGQSPAPGSHARVGSTVELVLARAPRWHVIFSRSGSSVYKSPRLNVPAQWRIHYTVSHTGEFGGFVSFSIDAVGLGGSDYFQADEGSDYYSPAVGAGKVQIEVDPTDATWSIVVEVLD